VSLVGNSKVVSASIGTLATNSILFLLNINNSLCSYLLYRCYMLGEGSEPKEEEFLRVVSLDLA